MEEARLRALCTDNIHYLTLEAQALVETKAHRTLSSSAPSFVHFAVKLENHWAAVQLAITPFTIQHFPDQVFFESSYRYMLCCASADPSSICNAVQRAYDVHYRPIDWNFSSQYYVLRDPVGQPDHAAKCPALVFNKLRQYIRLASTRDYTGIDILRHLDTAHHSVHLSSKRPYDQRDIACQSYANKHSRHYTPRNGSWSRDSEEREEGSSQGEWNEVHERLDDQPDESSNQAEVCEMEHPEVQPDCGTAGFTVEDSAEKIANKINKGIDTLKKRGGKGLISAQQLWPDPSDQTEEELWTQANEVSQMGREVTWMSRYLASCFALTRTKLVRYSEMPKINVKGVDEELEEEAEEDVQEVEEVEKDVKKGASLSTRKRWTFLARMVNSIIDGLYEAWGRNSYLVCFALAVQNYAFSIPTRQSEETQLRLASLVVTKLSGGVNPDIQVHWWAPHPAVYASRGLNRTYAETCTALCLSKEGTRLLMSTQTTELHQRFILQIHPSVSESSAKSDAYGTESVLVPSPSRMTLWAHDTRGTSPWSSNIDPMSSSSELASQAVPNRNEGVIFDTEPIPGFTTADCNTVSAINAARTDCPSREVSIQGDQTAGDCSRSSLFDMDLELDQDFAVREWQPTGTVSLRQLQIIPGDPGTKHV